MYDTLIPSSLIYHNLLHLIVYKTSTPLYLIYIETETANTALENNIITIMRTTMEGKKINSSFQD
jgi:hypothetical protein